MTYNNYNNNNNNNNSNKYHLDLSLSNVKSDSSSD